MYLLDFKQFVALFCTSSYSAGRFWSSRGGRLFKYLHWKALRRQIWTVQEYGRKPLEGIDEPGSRAIEHGVAIDHKDLARLDRRQTRPPWLCLQLGGFFARHVEIQAARAQDDNIWRRSFHGLGLHRETLTSTATFRLGRRVERVLATRALDELRRPMPAHV